MHCVNMQTGDCSTCYLRCLCAEHWAAQRRANAPSAADSGDAVPAPQSIERPRDDADRPRDHHEGR